MRAREAWSSSACRRTSSSDSWRAESSSTLCRARATWRASSVSIVSSSVVNWSPPGGRTATIKPSTWPECVVGATRRIESRRPSNIAGSHTSSHAVPVTPARATTNCSSWFRASRVTSSLRAASGIAMPLTASVSTARIHSSMLWNVHATTAAANDSTTDWAP